MKEEKKITTAPVGFEVVEEKEAPPAPPGFEVMEAPKGFEVVEDAPPAGFELAEEPTPKDDIEWDKQSAEAKALSLMDTSVGGSDPFMDTEISKLSKKLGVSEEFIKEQIPWALGQTEEQAKPGVSLERTVKELPEAAKIVGGTIDEALGRIPSSLVNYALYDEKERKAIDVIQEMASKKLSFAGDVARGVGMVGGGAITAKLGQLAVRATKNRKLIEASKTPLGMITAGMVEGAAYGAGEAETGKALGEAAEGAVLGGAIGGTIAGGIKLLGKMRAAKVPPEDLQKAANDIGLDYDTHLASSKADFKTELNTIQRYVEDEKFAARVDKISKDVTSEIKNQVKLTRVPDDGIAKRAKEQLSKLSESKKRINNMRRIGTKLKASAGQPQLKDDIAHEFTVHRLAPTLKELSRRVKSESSFTLGFGDSLTTARVLDGKFGIGLEKAMQDAGHLQNKAKSVTAWANKEIREKLKSLPKTVGRDTLVGKTEGLSSQEEALRDLSESIYKRVEETFGVTLPKQEGFILPRVMKTNEEWLLGLDDQLGASGVIPKFGGPRGQRSWSIDEGQYDKAIGKIQSRKLVDSLKEATSSSSLREVVEKVRAGEKVATDIIRHEFGSVEDFLDKYEFYKVVRHVRKVTGETDGRAALEASYNGKSSAGTPEEWFISRLAKRDEQDMRIPDWAVSHDVEGALSRYARDVAKGVALSKPISTFKAALQLARKTGDEGSAKWLNDTLEEMTGISSSIDSIPARMFTQVRDMGTRALINYQRGDMTTMNAAASMLPYAIQTMTRMVYPNLLSKPISMVKNATSPITSTFPYLLSNKLGLVETTKIMTGALADSIQDLYKVSDGKGIFAGLNNIRKGESDILKRGLVHSHFNADMAESLSTQAMKGLLKDTKMGKTLNNADKAQQMYTNFFLYGFQVSETMARVMAKNMASRAAKSMAENTDLGKKVLQNADSMVLKRSKWAREGIPKIGTKEFDEFETAVIDTVNANTMFNYDRANMSRHFRYLGPLFSQFSKWPMMQVGKIGAAYKTKSIPEASIQLSQSLLFPLIVAMGIDKLAEEQGLADDDVYRAWVGKLRDYTPLSSLESVTREDRINPPAIATISSLLNALTNPEEGAAKFLKNFWDYYGISAPEKTYQALETTTTGTYDRTPSQKLFRQLEGNKKGR